METIERKIPFQWMTENYVAPLSQNRCAIFHLHNCNWQESKVINIVHIQKTRALQSRHGFFIDSRCPRSFKVTQDRFKLFSIVTLRKILFIPGFEPFQHLSDPIFYSWLVLDCRGHWRKGDMLYGMVLVARGMRHVQCVAVLSCSELYSVKNGVESLKPYRAAVSQDVIQGVLWWFLQSGRPAGSNWLLCCQLLKHQLATKTA